jgi:hypothetical protein
MKKSYDFSKGKRGAVLGRGQGKTRITIRIDDDVLEWFRKRVHEAGGGNYQTLMNEALRQQVEAEVEPLEETLRRVLYEVLPETETRAARKRPARKEARRKAWKPAARTKAVQKSVALKKAGRKKAARKKAQRKRAK